MAKTKTDLSNSIRISDPPTFASIPKFTTFSGYSIDLPWMSIERWIASVEEGGVLDLDPDFQRAHVWDSAKQQAYVEFCLRGGESARNIYFNCATWRILADLDYVVLVDGKQRLNAVRMFLTNQVPAFGHYYTDYTDKLKPFHPSLRVNINDLQTRAEVLQWYLEMNSGGVVHTESELAKVRRLLAEERAQAKKLAKKLAKKKGA